MAKKKGGKQKAKPKPKQESANPIQNDKEAESKINLDSEVSSEVITAALRSSLVSSKVCRLCENKYGPFLNIFDAEKTTAKKIDTLMPFKIAENDELSHKICYRCSAKLEELYEFVQKCIETQVKLSNEIGLKEPLFNKKKTCEICADKLNKSNGSSDDIYEAIIRKAMEGIKDIPLDSPVDDTDIKKPGNKYEKRIYPKRDRKEIEKEDESKIEDLPSKKAKLEKNTVQHSENQKLPRSSCTNTEEFSEKQKQTITFTDTNEKSKPVTSLKCLNDEPVDVDKHNTEQNKKIESVDSDNTQTEDKFNIMNHISMIKVNGVGLLFQCKLCNRNFLKKEVVLSHGCAKNKGTKSLNSKDVAPKSPIEIPKVPTVKYINTKTISKPIVIDDNTPPSTPINVSSPVTVQTVPKQVKPKIGPASKVKRHREEINPTIGMTVTPQSSIAPASGPPAPVSDLRVNFPSVPNINGRYKLVPGPNNSFMLVEESPSQPATGVLTDTKIPEAIPEQPAKPPIKVKSTESLQTSISNDQPYPVGFFQTPKPLNPEPTTFTTPAVKQSYTIVQTGNPSKLLISTKPQTPVPEPLNKKRKKLRPEEKAPETFSATSEDSSSAKNNGFFTFINVDPLTQPSYVLPTSNIIQESQITTSTSSNKNTPVKDTNDGTYTCNLCSEIFTREKKLLTHIQSHYNKMDKEDSKRNENISKKRGKKT